MEGIDKMVKYFTDDDIVALFVEKYFDSEVKMQSLTGGFLNSANNPEESILNITDGKKSCVLKMATNKENVTGYLEKIFSEESYTRNNLEKIIDGVLNFYPEYKELIVYDYFKQNGMIYIPDIYYLGIQKKTSKSYIFMENLSGQYKFNALINNENIDFEDIKVVMKNLGEIHIWGHRIAKEKVRMIPQIDFEKIKIHKEYFHEITQICQVRYERKLGKEIFELLDKFLYYADDVFDCMANGEMVLTHNDFNLRNTCLRQKKDKLYLIAYDWDVCRIQNPEFDFIEYILFLPNKISKDELMILGNIYMENAVFYTEGNRKYFWKMVLCNLIWFSLYKFCIYGIIDQVNEDMMLLLEKNIFYYFQMLQKNVSIL